MPSCSGYVVLVQVCYWNGQVFFQILKWFGAHTEKINDQKGKNLVMS